MHWHGVFCMFPAGGAGFPIPMVRLGWDSHFAGGVGLVPRVSPKSSPKARKVWEWSRALPLGTGPKVRKVWESVPMFQKYGNISTGIYDKLLQILL